MTLLRSRNNAGILLASADALGSVPRSRDPIGSFPEPSNINEGEEEECSICCLAPGLPGVFEVADQLFLLGIHADYWPSCRLKDAFLSSQELKLFLPTQDELHSPLAF